MIKLTHNIYTAVSGDCFRLAAPTIAQLTATMLTVSQNWRNRRILSQMFRPHITARTILLKLSSRSMMSAASFAISVPAIPIANPMSAFFSAGASLVPSPVTATTWPSQRRPVTRVYLSCGLERARTSSRSMIRENSFMFLTTSSRISSSFAALRESLGQSHSAVSHFLQTVPPVIASNSLPSIIRD